MKSSSKLASRRRFLRGVLNGVPMVVGLPLLDCFWNDNGTALAATGAAPSPCFVSWMFGLGFNPGRWAPSELGKIREFGPELQALNPFMDKINVFSGFRAILDSKPNLVHNSGVYTLLTGQAPSAGVQHPPTIDTLVSSKLGTRTRFRSIEVNAGGAALSLSERGNGIVNPAEGAPVALYQKLFGPDFVDPNAAEFTPDPEIVLNKSALSVVAEERQRLMSQVGTADRQRLDEYFTSLRELEQGLEIQLERPAPLPSCSKPDKPQEIAAGSDIEVMRTRNRLFSRLIAHAFACGQTHVANMIYNHLVYMTRPGSANHHHLWTHEEPIDHRIGYQPQVALFNLECAGALADTLTALNNIKEGSGTVLDRSVVLVGTDVGFAQAHGIDNIPMFLIGSGGGRFKTGLHISAGGDSVTRVGFTAMQGLGLTVGEWGSESNKTARPITEVLA